MYCSSAHFSAYRTSHYTTHLTAYRAAFDLSRDPTEQHNRIHEAPESVDHLRDALMAYEELCSQHAIAPRLSAQFVEKLPVENVEELESLGYL